jgi:hypothetical protein
VGGKVMGAESIEPRPWKTYRGGYSHNQERTNKSIVNGIGVSTAWQIADSQVKGVVYGYAKAESRA